ncbi:hypothetical protein BH10PSE9_BH10PSE9_10930 [soil metagenome]
MTTSSRTGRLTLAGMLAAASLLAPMSHVLAGETAERAGEAEALLHQDKPAAALSAFDRASDAFWGAMPFGIRTALFASSVAGFGRYEPRAEGAFRSGEAATIYLEPVAYGFLGEAGQLTVAFTVGIEVRTPGGLTLARVDDIGRVTWQGRVRSREIHTAVNVTLPALKPGSYKLVLTLTDAATGRSATADLPFRIAG